MQESTDRKVHLSLFGEVSNSIQGVEWLFHGGAAQLFFGRRHTRQLKNNPSCGGESHRRGAEWRETRDERESRRERSSQKESEGERAGGRLKRGEDSDMRGSRCFPYERY